MGGLRMGANGRKRANDDAHHRGDSGRYTRLPSAARRTQYNTVGSCISQQSEPRAPKDNKSEVSEALLRLVVQRLEDIARLIDELDDHLEQISQGIMSEAAQKVTGAGVVGLVIRAETLAVALDGFAAVIRSNEVQRLLPREALSD